MSDFTTGRVSLRTSTDGTIGFTDGYLRARWERIADNWCWLIESCYKVNRRETKVWRGRRFNYWSNR